MVLWTTEHRMFAFNSYIKNNESVTTVRREFRRQFNVYWNWSVTSHKRIVRWVNVRHTQGIQTVCTPENVECVRQVMLRSLNQSAWRHSIELGIGNRSIRNILHEDLYFHPYKLVVVQQLKQGDYAQRLNSACQMKAIFETNDNPILLMNEAHFHLNDESTELSLLDPWKSDRTACKTTV